MQGQEGEFLSVTNKRCSLWWLCWSRITIVNSSLLSQACNSYHSQGILNSNKRSGISFRFRTKSTVVARIFQRGGGGGPGPKRGSKAIERGECVGGREIY